MKKSQLWVITFTLFVSCLTANFAYGQNGIKGVTREGNEGGVWSSYQNSIWNAYPFVNEYGSIVPWPRLTRYGELLRYAPLLRTDSVYNISAKSAEVAGTIWHNGWCNPILVRGFQFASDTAFTADTVRVNQLAPTFKAYDICMPPCPFNAYSDTLKPLKPGTKYFVRAFARNNCG